jgi:hypothetical protein
MVERYRRALRVLLAMSWLTACARGAGPQPSVAGASPGSAALGGSGGGRGDPDAGARDSDAGEHTDGVVSALGSAGCKRAAGQYGAGTTAAQLSHAGSMRTFRVHLPRTYQSGVPRPLLLMLHGAERELQRERGDLALLARPSAPRLRSRLPYIGAIGHCVTIAA